MESEMNSTVNEEIVKEMEKEEENENEIKRRKLNNCFQSKKELRIPEPSQDSNKKVFSIEQPFIFLSEDNENIKSIKEFYGLSDQFPKDQWVVRSETEKQRSIYYISESVKSIINSDDSYRILVVNTGVKIFYRNEGDGNVKCLYRIVNEGLNTIAPYLSEKRKLKACFEDIKVIVEGDYPMISSFTEETRKALEAIDQSSFIFCFQPTEEERKNGCNIRNRLLLPVWKARTSVNLLMKKAEKRSLSWRLLGKELEEKKLKEKN